MADPPCTFEDNNPGVMLLHMLATGDVTVICEEHRAPFALLLASELSEGLSPEECELLGEYFDKIAANDLRAGASGAKTATKRSRKPSGDTDADDATDAASPDTGPSSGTANDARAKPEDAKTARRKSRATTPARSAADATDAAPADGPDPSTAASHGTLTATDEPFVTTGPSSVTSDQETLTVEPFTDVITVELEPPCPGCGYTEGTGDNEKLTCNRCGKVIAHADGSTPDDSK